MLNNMKKLFTKNYLQKTNQGFTLVETLVAVLILSLALNGILTLITSSIFSARYAKNEITAMYLAQEAIDHIRNDRDTTAFQGPNKSWDDFLSHYGYNIADPATSTKCFAMNGCQFEATDWVPTDVKACGQSCDSLYYNDSTSNSNLKYYSYSSTNAKETLFKRKISIQSMSMSLGDHDEIFVTVKVEWQDGNLPRSQTLTTSLLKWQ